MPSPHPFLLFSPLPFFTPLPLCSPHPLSLKLSSPWPFLLQGLRILGLVEGLDSPSVGVTWEGPHQGSNSASLSVTLVTMALWLFLGWELNLKCLGPSVRSWSVPQHSKKKDRALRVKDSVYEGHPAISRTSRAEKKKIMGGQECRQRNRSHLKVTLARRVWSSFCHFCQPPQAPGIPCITVFQSTFPWDEFNGLIKVTLCTNWEVSEALRQLSCIYTHKVLTAEQGRQFKTQKHPWVNYFLLVCHIFLRYDCSFRRWQQQLTIKLCTLFYLYFFCLSIVFVLFFSSFP